ncbi:N-acetylmuramoyl-L-alanine amidase [Candidatus Sulfurimonas marisnigri]|uniref:N-acetylmuramoyl-L-alanine amidase n=1 Tax=Candidatus Sulfurimonas marisnigri TaxID=2740405 RepID=A0A7S7LZW1_9BACT|nr:peptidoglycan recognition family protein [Candidatus Sulfurimonas marisnigri]QOY54320.1 N-acetylmuramoyl-L-alanine amidase [Candidatus Sulfurimonas marisnigri]
MTKLFLLLISLSLSLAALEIRQTPIKFTKLRYQLTKEYIKTHYEIDANNINIIPKIVVVHHTAIDDYRKSLARFSDEKLPSDRPDIDDGSPSVNVSTHFMVERDGTIHQLMPLKYMARHVIGLNYSSIGIENVGGENSKDNLTEAQLKANVNIIEYLQQKYASIRYVVGHYEYRCFEGDDLWLEKDKSYRTKKDDPSKRFMEELFGKLDSFTRAPCD